MNWLFCCFKTLSVCGLRDCMVNSSAFQPPDTKKYQLKYDREDLIKGPVYKMMLPGDDGKMEEAEDLKGTEMSVVLLETKTSSQIPALFIENKNCKSNVVILYSHGNSTDLGRMLEPLQELAYSLNVHVFAYEYSGYGPSKGNVGEIEIMYGITAAYEFLTKQLGFKWHYIVLYGRSIGSGPTVYLATHPDYPVSGVILHSPLASGFRVFDSKFKNSDPSDLFPNCDFIEHAKAHVFVIHGEQDTEVPVTHGKLLVSKCKNAYPPWWVAEGDHHNIDFNFPKLYYTKLGKFLRHVRDFNMDLTSIELYNYYKVEPWWKNSNHCYFKRIPKVEENYKKQQKKNGNKNMKAEGFFAEASLNTQRSVNDKMLQPSPREQTTRENDEGKSRIEQELRDMRAYTPPRITEEDLPVQKKRNSNVEIEFASYNGSNKFKNHDGEHSEDGPREVKYKGERIISKETKADEEDTFTVRQTEPEEPYLRTFATREN